MLNVATGTRAVFQLWLKEIYRMTYSAYHRLSAANRKPIYQAYQKDRPQYATYWQHKQRGLRK